ncbi:MAG: hypothetical protein A2821_02185 [Candidatus Magasanikbacteria bacterium RIFCSPHIGHO2_01_FULL_41_23]|uniref:Uncharacterized protein n=1 Tax=Candidatus Magasanikbacteria bacterium RIFCSPLOWO2_01_FULL_40_15 TaxID=1798686 RepID=A0A1F6N3B2_9BACT|nr:MAG: hypothetical protein A2821_02185 [Candidatus Magasanikbacteria bacterium RIFCSPHIGHO2_01_FULL_41_23]OGH76452.1 MAG: hypothetical protein A3F22_00690 [Candidatus Magasanikbacteria bacterium RIFCSPHIGHO2_12_FULL_41_16]OGH78409.1 MAG: hypothetical protein A2983_02645 [Candidatus Magasanikbacteria bacterium RIFCSPLOWO2_01_FULL_40_15]
MWGDDASRTGSGRLLASSEEGVGGVCVKGDLVGVNLSSQPRAMKASRTSHAVSRAPTKMMRGIQLSESAGSKPSSSIVVGGGGRQPLPVFSYASATLRWRCPWGKWELLMIVAPRNLCSMSAASAYGKNYQWKCQ